jgi:periplasmic divalent cation tolerance protein
VGEGVSQIQVSHSDRAALQEIVDRLLEQRLIACAQLIGPISSSFRWEGALQHEEEWLALLKTASNVVDDVLARVAQMHSYDVPEILVVHDLDGHHPYLQWVLSETGQGASSSPAERRSEV